MSGLLEYAGDRTSHATITNWINEDAAKTLIGCISLLLALLAVGLPICYCHKCAYNNRQYDTVADEMRHLASKE